MKQNAKFYAGSPRLAACSWGLCWEVKIWYRFDWHKPARLTKGEWFGARMPGQLRDLRYVLVSQEGRQKRGF